MKPDPLTPPLLHSIDTAKRLLGNVSKTTIFAAINRGDLERVYVFGRSMITDESIRRCARGGLAVFDGRGLHYRDDVTSFGTSEPTDDAAALALLAFSQQATIR